MSKKQRKYPRGYTIIDNRILREYNLTAHERLVMIVIQSYAGTGTAYPSISTIAIDSGLSVRTVKRVISSLDINGFIVRSSGQLAGTSNHYKLTNVIETLGSTLSIEGRSGLRTPLGHSGTPPGSQWHTPLGHSGTQKLKDKNKKEKRGGVPPERPKNDGNNSGVPLDGGTNNQPGDQLERYSAEYIRQLISDVFRDRSGL